MRRHPELWAEVEYLSNQIVSTAKGYEHRRLVKLVEQLNEVVDDLNEAYRTGQPVEREMTFEVTIRKGNK